MNSQLSADGSPRFPLVSAVVPSRNSARTLGLCLQSIQRQSYPNIEIVVVDGHSADASINICRNLGIRVVSVSYGLERTAKKNLGAKITTGKYVYFVDSDFELQPTVVTECVGLCERGADGVIVSERVSCGTGFWSKCRSLESVLNAGDDNVETVRFVSRRAFLEFGGFDEEIVFGEDNELGNRLRERGYKISRAKSHVLHHDIDTRSMVIHKFYYGRTAVRYLARRRTVAMKQFSFVRVGWTRQRTLVRRYPAYFMGIIAIQLAKYFAAVSGVIVGFFSPSVPSRDPKTRIQG